MKSFFKWSIGAAGMLGFMLVILYITGQVKIGLWESILVILLGSLLFGVFFFIIEDIYFPFRRKQMLKKLKQVFDAQILSESKAQFKVGEYDIFIEIDFVLGFNKYVANGEIISFHLKRSQLKHKKLKRPLSQVEELFDGKPTYRIYQTNGMGLKLAKRRIEKSLKGI